MHGRYTHESLFNKNRAKVGKVEVAFHDDKKQPRSLFTDRLTDKELSKYLEVQLVWYIEKKKIYRAVAKSVLVYDSKAWTLTKQLEDNLGGTYSRMLCAILNKSWLQHPTEQELTANNSKLQRMKNQICWLLLAKQNWISEQTFCLIPKHC